MIGTLSITFGTPCPVPMSVQYLYSDRGLGWVLALQHKLDMGMKLQVQVQKVNIVECSDVTIFESKSKIAILARNRIESKLRFPCTTETILSIVAFARFTLPCCDEIQITPVQRRRQDLPFIRR